MLNLFLRYSKLTKQVYIQFISPHQPVFCSNVHTRVVQNALTTSFLLSTEKDGKPTKITVNRNFDCTLLITILYHIAPHIEKIWLDVARHSKLPEVFSNDELIRLKILTGHVLESSSPHQGGRLGHSGKLIPKVISSVCLRDGR